MISHKDLANAIRVLSIDAIEKAQSGHPGAPMGMADIAEVLWHDFLNHNPENPSWPNRDRFVLSNGHASMLIYSLLHLTGYNLSLEEIKKFRQMHSKTPGHPEIGYTDGVETTTGPLGQGIANAVGMAIAEKTLAAQFNLHGHNIVDHFTYVFLGDGCMMEGISHEVCSLAGVLELGKLIAFYDDNGISIDGKVEGWFKDDTAKRFESYNWHVIRDINGHNAEDIKYAIKAARVIRDKPSLLICKTVIGFGSPNKAGTHYAHGSPLGEKEVFITRQALDWKYPPFEIPSEIYLAWDSKEAGKKKETIWKEKFSVYKKIFPQKAKEFLRRTKGEISCNFEEYSKEFIKQLQTNPKLLSGRQASQNTIEVFSRVLPEIFGGSADLSPSNLTLWSGAKSIDKYNSGNYIHYGVREFGMIAIANGIALHGGFLPYTSTFLMFMEYARSAVRMAALMKQRQIMVYTHDSIGLGEDGATHQPIEQIAFLRMTPNMSTWRPCDQVECAVAWKDAINRQNGPTSLVLSRQSLVQQERTQEQLENISRGGYILKDCQGSVELILIATGSEVQLAVSAWNKLIAEGIKARVVSMPSTDVFDKQDIIYCESVLPKKVTARIAIEASIKDYWFKYVGLNGSIIGISTFGKSAPGKQLFEEFGFTVEHIVAKAKKLLDEYC